MLLLYFVEYYLHKVFCQALSSATDIYYISHRCTHSDVESRKNLRALLTIVGMLDSTAIDVLQSLSSDISDFEDAVMVETAKRASVDCIVTRNQKDYAKSPVPVFSPGEFLEHLMSSNEEPLE